MMGMYVRRYGLVFLAVVLLGLSACGSRQLTGELLQLQQQTESQMARDMVVDLDAIEDVNVRELRERALNMLRSAREFFAAAEQQHNKRKDDEASALTRIGLLYYSAAENFHRTAESRVRMRDANQTFEAQRQRRNEYQGRLQAEQELVGLLTTVNRLFEANEALRRQLATVEEQGRAVNRAQYAIQEARMMQREAQGVSAQRHAASSYDTATASLNRAQVLYDDEAWEQATQVALEALEQYRRAVEDSRPAFGAQQERLLQNPTASAIFERVRRTFGDQLAYVDNRGIVVVLPYLFAQGSPTIRPEQLVRIEEIATLLGDHSRQRVLVEGHTRDEGSTADNQALGDQRVRSMREFLTSRNIRANRIDARSHGEEAPRFSNETEEGKRNNDRVEVIFLF
jgi:outer membrane protein OmpA-like peptidoglycan-associated protein